MRLNETLDVYRRNDFMSLSLKEKRVVEGGILKKYEKVKKKTKSISVNIPNNSPVKKNDFVYNFNEATK